ncbi:DDB1- and CUL4-associated factor 8 [Achroia grisella]|uniref:DDB1- and CUL4-associated factor 8 n=1 Tax=Achroia grisella TaxID=688607 RepID=UPI0027D298F4|nr:DDB1- and CUL4-associated factor 8 [Achroia grisella]
MEDNPSTDGETQDSPLRSTLSSKKLKLNDGSSQDCSEDAASSSIKEEKDDNVDSGVYADKSESTSSDDRLTRTSEGPSNELVNAASTSSNVRAILSDIKNVRRGRNYRKRKTPGRDSDSNDTSRDSDDLSAEETVLNTGPQMSSSSAADSEDNEQRLFGLFSNMSHSGSPSSFSSYSDDDSSSGSNMNRLQSGDTDSDDDGHWDRSMELDESHKPPSVLFKVRPKHNYHLCKELIKRELGLTFPYGNQTKPDVMFEKRFYGSLHAVYRLDSLHHLNAHAGCVNSINFHPEGKLLASGSDDTNVIVWDWARNIPLQSIKTGHKSNVFQSRFLYLNSGSQLNIVTCARDGQVRLVQCAASGGSATRRRLGAHARAAHKLHVSPAEPHLVLSAGEDGLVMQCDVREHHAARLMVVKEPKRDAPIPLYTIHGHPLDIHEVIVGGRDKFLRTYDRRKCTKPLHMYCPPPFIDNTDVRKSRYSKMHLTCAIYNHNGSEILVSYNDEDIFLYDTKRDVYDIDDVNEEKQGFTHRYSGHRNCATFKGVSFFGPNSEYIVSGSDCSHIYIWEKKSESIVQWMRGDDNGIVNCIEAHPRCPVLATSGLDKDVKIWIPKREADPEFKGLEMIVCKNSVSSLPSPVFSDFLPSLYRARSIEIDHSFQDDMDFENNCSTF